MKNPVGSALRPMSWAIARIGGFLIALLVMVSCQEPSTAPTDREVGRQLAGAQNPEEELLGGVFRNGQLPSPTNSQRGTRS